MLAAQKVAAEQAAAQNKKYEPPVKSPQTPIIDFSYEFMFLLQSTASALCVSFFLLFFNKKPI